MGFYLSVGVLVVLVVARVVVLLDEAEVLLPLPLQRALPALCVGGEVALWGGEHLWFSTGQLQHLQINSV